MQQVQRFQRVSEFNRKRDGSYQQREANGNPQPIIALDTTIDSLTWSSHNKPNEIHDNLLFVRGAYSWNINKQGVMLSYKFIVADNAEDGSNARVEKYRSDGNYGVEQYGYELYRRI